MNNFRVVKKYDGTPSKDMLVECFKEIYSNHTNLAEYLLSEKKMRMRIAVKLGNTSLNVSHTLH